MKGGFFNMAIQNPMAGWGPFVLALGGTQTIGYGAVFYAYPILVPAIAAEFGVSGPMLFGVFSVGLLVGGLASPRLGRLLDQIGAPQVMAIGSFLAAILTASMAFAPNFASFAVLVILLQSISFTVLYDAAFVTLALKEPDDTRSAITRLTLIGGFASTVFWPLTGFAVETFGWRGTYMAFAMLHLGIALPLHLWIARKVPVPRAGQDTPVRAPRPEFPTIAPDHLRAAFVLLALGFAVTGMVIAAIGVHMVPVLLERGLGQTAFLVAMLMGPAQVMIRLVEAGFWRNFHPLSVAIISGAAVPLSFCALLLAGQGQGVGLAIVFALLFGAGQGLTSIVRGSVPLVLFGPAGIGARLGRLAGLRSVMSAAAPFLFAVSLAHLGPQITLWVCILLGVVGLGALVALRANLRVQGRWHAV
ncbi:MFS transporter [Roseinatronobacter sp. S2]|uniref:MFS transporter n=1 Tax=Roseinatronobacter sp. S2 TaxID=3035471 RepID=UPI00240F2AB8|nr:MFS transporter [Roseinatronobacter sp. S2]WFE74172.1 MFS transporter [Roseinatronobacter sp. S2]